MKTAWKLCLALALMVAAMFSVGISASAEGYQVHGKISRPDGAAAIEVEGLSFKLYEVGSFGRDQATGKATLVVDSSIRSILGEDFLNVPFSGDKTDPEWNAAWAEKSNTLALYIDQLPEENYKGEAITNEEGVFRFETGVKDGVYIVINSDPAQIIDDEEKEEVYSWSPQPIILMVLNGKLNGSADDDIGFGIKWTQEKIVNHFTVNKQWKSKVDKEVIHPDYVDVEIYFDYVDGEDKDNSGKLVDTVRLKADEDPKKNWSYSWTRKKYKDKVTELGGDPYRCTYTVKEVRTGVILSRYEVDIPEPTTADDQQTTVITNTYDNRKLKIKKILHDYVDHFQGATTDDAVKASTTFVFELTGKDSDGNVVYHAFAGLKMDAYKGEWEKEILVPDLPINMATLTVKEIYSGDYQPRDTEAVKDREVELSEPDENGTYSVEFENIYDNPTYSGGVINQFNRKLGDDKQPYYDWEAIGSVFKKAN